MALSDTQTFSGITATTASFQLWGGQYSFASVVTAMWELQRLLPDGVTWFNMVGSGSVTTTILPLPPGEYRLFTSGAPSGDDFEIVRF